MIIWPVGVIALGKDTDVLLRISIDPWSPAHRRGKAESVMPNVAEVYEHSLLEFLPPFD